MRPQVGTNGDVFKVNQEVGEVSSRGDSSDSVIDDLEDVDVCLTLLLLPTELLLLANSNILARTSSIISISHFSSLLAGSSTMPWPGLIGETTESVSRTGDAAVLRTICSSSPVARTIVFSMRASEGLDKLDHGPGSGTIKADLLPYRAHILAQIAGVYRDFGSEILNLSSLCHPLDLLPETLSISSFEALKPGKELF